MAPPMATARLTTYGNLWQPMATYGSRSGAIDVTRTGNEATTSTFRRNDAKVRTRNQFESSATIPSKTEDEFSDRITHQST